MQTLIEILRRLLPLACLLIGGWLFFWPGAPLLVVAPADFRHDFENRLTTTKEDLADPAAFQDFVRYRTEGRTRDVAGAQWLELAQRLEAPGPELAARTIRVGTRSSFVFRTDEPPFAPAGPFQEFQYLRVEQGAAWLTVSQSAPQDILGLPPEFAHPLRGWGLGLCAAGLLAYVLLPRRRPGPGELRYGRFSAVIAGDILGLFMATAFGLLPMLVIRSMTSDSSLLMLDALLSGGWIWLALAFWLMAGLGLFLLGVALRYALLAWRVDQDGLVRIMGDRETLLAWENMAGAEPYRGRAGRVIGGLLMVFGRSPGMVGQGVLVTGNEAYGARIRMKDGRKVMVMANSLNGFDAILKALVNNNVPGADRPRDFFASL